MQLYRIFLMAFCSFLISMVPSFAQLDAKSKKLLEATSAYYQAQKTFKLQFSFQNGKSAPSKGELGVKADKYYLKLVDQEMYNDGKVIYTYLKESKEVTIQNAADEQFSTLNPSKILSSYQKGYKGTYSNTRTEQGSICDIVVLQPTDKNSPVNKVELAISQKDSSLKSWKITEKNGSQTHYRVQKMEVTTALQDADFKFNEKQYPGVEIVDLR